MSCTPGKVRVAGVTELKGEKAFVLEFIQDVIVTGSHVRSLLNMIRTPGGWMI